MRDAKQNDYNKGDITMYDFELYNATTNEHIFIYGYDINDAWKRRPHLNRSEWAVIGKDYID